MPVRVFTEEEKAELREKMFEAGMDLIKTNGLTHTSVVRITDSVAIGKSTFYNFFESKEHFVVELISYERQKAMLKIKQMLNGRPKMTKEEGKLLLKAIIYDQDSIYQYLTEKDMETLYPVMVETGFVEKDLNSDTPEYLLSIIDEVDTAVNPKVFVNFLRMLAICVAEKESLHQDVLEQNIEMIFDKMFEYIFEE